MVVDSVDLRLKGCQERVVFVSCEGGEGIVAGFKEFINGGEESLGVVGAGLNEQGVVGGQGSI